MLSLSLLLIFFLTGTSVASPVSFDYDTFDFNEPLTPSPGLIPSPSPILAASNLELLNPYSGEGGGGGVSDFTVPSPPQQRPQQEIGYSQQQQQPELTDFKIADGEIIKAEEPDSQKCTKVCCQGHYGKILTFSTGKSGFDYVNQCSLRPSTF